MENETTNKGQVSIPDMTGVFKKPLFFNITYAVIALMFLLPFTEISCNGITMAKASGTDLAFGFEMKPSSTITNWTDTFDMGDHDNSSSNVSGSGRKKDPNTFALAALIISLIGLAFSVFQKPPRPTINFILSILGAVAMIALMIDLKGDVKNEMTSQGAESGITISLHFTAWFYLVLIGYIAIALISRRQRMDKSPVKEVSSSPPI